MLNLVMGVGESVLIRVFGVAVGLNRGPACFHRVLLGAKVC